MSDVVEGFRLSPQQKSLWPHQERDGPEAYRALVAALVQGPLEPERLREALARAVERHEILRTRFRRLPGVRLPVQVIGAPAPVELERVDASGEQPDAGPAVVEREVARLLARPLDPDGATLEARWVDFGGTGAERAGALILGVAPGLVDGAGLELLLAELLADCAGQLEGPAADPDADEGPLQYADLAEWQNELLEGDDGREGVAAWRRQGLPARPPLDLPVAGPPGERWIPARVDVGFPRADGGDPDPLSAAAAGLGLEPEHLALAAWLVLLWRRSGQEERLLGVGLDGRGYEELGAAVGLFERELPLAIEVRPEESGAELARRAAAGLAELAERQDCFAWDRAVDGLTEEPALPIGFGVDDHLRWHRSGELALRVLRRRAPVQPSVLRAVLVRSPSGAGFELHHDAARLPAGLVERIGAELVSLATQLARDPSRPVAELDPTLDPASGAPFADLLEGAAAAGPDYPRDATVHGLIAARAAARPEAVAVRCGGASLTYGELVRRARALAGRLAALGAGPDQRVGVCGERSLDLAVALVGVLEAGAGYVPVDPGYPAERIAFLLEDAGCRALVVTRRALLERLPPALRARGGTPLVVLEDEPAGETGASGAPGASGGAASPQPGRDVGPEGLAYVIYTSGSTGTPKGVEVTHRNLVHSTTARTVFYGADPARYLVVSSYAFDSSVAGIFWTLCTGGTLVLPEEGEERDVRELARLIEAERVTCTLMLPSLWNLLLDHGGVERLSSLERVIVAGEACTRELVEKHRRLLPGCALVNEYGPTEGTVWASAFDCAGLGPQGPVPIGRPIPRTAAYLLDERQRPVAPGAPGELWIGGEGVARGYLGRPELTGERFRPDPFAAADGAPRMYRTGDLARRLPDGALEFLGRVDHQVKVRGYRVELGEIEEALSAHPAVAEAVCLAREDTPGDQRLVAYVTPAGDPGPSETELGAYLRERLPDYMVPQAFVVLEAMPRTPNGKLDRGALPAPEASRRALSSAYEEPRTPLERACAEVWAEVLDVPRVGLADDFFELGGHSILAVRLVARLGETLGLEVGLRGLFDAPTVAGLLAGLAADPRSGAALERVAALLAEVEGLSDDEVEAALGGGRPEPGAS